MGLRFTEVTYSLKDGSRAVDRFPGHPDEETLTSDSYFKESLETLGQVCAVGVQHYRFMTDSSDEDADCNHFSLMDAYNELAGEYGGEPFTERDDVEHLGYFELKF